MYFLYQIESSIDIELKGFKKNKLSAYPWLQSVKLKMDTKVILQIKH